MVLGILLRNLWYLLPDLVWVWPTKKEKAHPCGGLFVLLSGSDEDLNHWRKWSDKEHQAGGRTPVPSGRCDVAAE